MSDMPKILILAGSLREGSFNHRLATVAAALLRERGCEVDLVEQSALELPLVNPDLEDEAGPPAAARALGDRFAAAEALLFCSPEYNSSITPALKNAIDWVSRKTADRPGLGAFRGKVAALLATSPGRLGGMRALVHLRAILGNIGVLVTPSQYAMGGAGEAFDDEGGLARDVDRQQVEAVLDELLRVAAALH